MNPFRYLATSLRAQLRLEESLPPNEVPHTQWMALVSIADTKIVVGRGGKNTCFLTLNGKRRVDFPAKMLSLLDTLGRQSHGLFQILTGDDVTRQSFKLSRLLEEPASSGSKIIGINTDGTANILYTAKRNVRGKLVWLPVKGD